MQKTKSTSFLICSALILGLQLAHAYESSRDLVREPTINDAEYSGYLSKELVLPLISAQMANRKSIEIGATRGHGDTKIADSLSKSTVAILSDSGTGSGVVISKNGKIVTNYHVIGESKVVDVFFHEENKDVEELDVKKGNVIRVNGKNDLALIQVKSISKNIVPIQIAQSLPKVGDDAHAVGHPNNQWWTYTKGYVSRVRQKYKWNYAKEKWQSR